MFLINQNDNNYSNSTIAPPTTTTITTYLKNSTIDETKLLNSINILKNIIDRISKGPPSDNQKNRNNYESSDSLQEYFAIAKESVTLSYKDYLLIHKSSTSKPFSLLTTNYLSSSVINSKGLPTVKTFLNDYMKVYFNSTRSISNHATKFFYSNHSLNNNFKNGDIFKYFLNYSAKMLNSSHNDKNILLQLPGMITNNYTSVNDDYFSLYNSPKITPPYMLESSEFGSKVFNPNSKNPYTHVSSNNNTSSLLIGIAFFYSFLIITSMISNPLLIYVLLWRRKAQIKLIDIFVANLSISDLFLTIFNIPLCLIIYFSEQWPFGSLLCQLGTFSTSCSIYVNIFTMAFISIDRYFAVTRPMISNPNCQLRKKSASLDNTTRRKIYLVLTVIWIVALVLSLPQFLYSKVSSRTTNNNSDTDFNAKTKLLKYEFKKQFKANSPNFIFDNFNHTEKNTENTFGFSNFDPINSGEFDGDSFKFDEELENMENLEMLRGVDFGEDPLKRCILEYPLKDMKNYMILVNFSLQYLIPSIVILYFYGKIIYHLYLNLNVEDLMETPTSNNHNNKIKIKKAKSSFELDKTNNLDGHPNKPSVATSFLTYKIRLHKSGITASSASAVNTLSDLRQGGLNRTRNLKKSIKVMIIIIALFLLSWLPIHVYRLVTTFYPPLLKLTKELFYLNPISLGSNSSKSYNSTSNELCKRNITSKECLSFALRELRDIDDKNSLNYKLNTLHNRYVFFFCYCIAMSSVCYNPIVYFWMHKKFRAEVKQLFARIFSFLSCKNSSNKFCGTIETNQAANNHTRIGHPTQTNMNTSTNIYNNKRSSAGVLVNNNKNTNSQYGDNKTKFGIFLKNNQSINNEIEPLNINTNSNKNIVKKKRTQPSILRSLKSRNKRFSSLSSESTASSSKKSVGFG